MNIDIERLDNLVSNADQILIRPEAEQVLLQLLDIQEQVESALKEAKKKIEESALRINPNFKSIKADNIKVYYRQYGQKYRLDESYLPQISKELYKLKTAYSVISKAVDEWTDQHGGLPVGIREAEREKSLTFSKRDKDSYETEIEGLKEEIE